MFKCQTLINRANNEKSYHEDLDIQQVNRIETNPGERDHRGVTEAAKDITIKVRKIICCNCQQQHIGTPRNIVTKMTNSPH